MHCLVRLALMSCFFFFSSHGKSMEPTKSVASCTDPRLYLVTVLIYRIHRQSRPCNFKGGNHVRDMDGVSEAKLIDTFDELVSQGVILYGPHESVKLEAEGYPVSDQTIKAKQSKAKQSKAKQSKARQCIHSLTHSQINRLNSASAQH